MIVNENIIRNALNESIDEFLLEDEINWGGGIKGAKDWWNNSANGQRVKNGLSKAWNGIKNAAAMYMDYRTNGQWNNKYGIYANGNGKTTELYYLNKWFNTHLENIRKIEYRNNTPNADFSKSREYVERNGEKVYTDTEIQEKDINTYVQKNITPQNFNNWVGSFIKDRQALELIDNYILKCQRSVNDLQSAMKWLNTGSFLADANTGQIYIKTRNSELGGQRQQYQKQSDKNGVINLFNYLFYNSDKITKEQLYNNVQKLGNTFNISNNGYKYVENYLIRLIKMLNDNDTINKRWNYLKANTFFKSGYGKYFV